jgi:N-acetylglucosamine-6-phosphate deacetylase
MKLTARSLSGEILDVHVDGPVFGRVDPHPGEILDLPWIAPGLVDIQINGFGGIDFNRALESDEAWEHATRELYAHGCTGFLIALITNREEGYRELLGPLTSRLRRDPRNCLGFHMEGPWLNPDPAFRGAHRAEWMQTPSLRLLEEWRAIAGDLLKMVTLAPEIDLEESVKVIQAGRADGIQFFLGHSGAMGETLARAVAAGAVGWTHLGNAAPALAPKFENVLLHVLAEPGLMTSLIPDGLHVPPHAFRALARALEQSIPSRLLLTTDAMAGAAAGKPGRYTLGEVEVEVGSDGSARLADATSGPGRLAGSTLTPFAGVFRAEQMAGLYLEDAWDAFSTRPASILGRPHGLVVGHPADFCLISPEKEPYLLATYQQGRCVYEAP